MTDDFCTLAAILIAISYVLAQWPVTVGGSTGTECDDKKHHFLFTWLLASGTLEADDLHNLP